MTAGGLAISRRNPRGTIPGGEAETVHRGGGRYVSVIGSNALFHNPDDRGRQAVDLGAIANFTKAFAAVADALIAQRLLASFACMLPFVRRQPVHEEVLWPSASPGSRSRKRRRCLRSFTPCVGLLFVPFFLLAGAFAPGGEGSSRRCSPSPSPSFTRSWDTSECAIGCPVYNMVAGWVGGIEIELDQAGS